jgi:WW domain binding protein 11
MVKKKASRLPTPLNQFSVLQCAAAQGMAPHLHRQSFMRRLSSLTSRSFLVQGGRDMNPADAFRKVQRQKEIQRNKRERQFQRDASKLKSERLKQHVP